MPEHKVNLTGWQALIAGLVLLAILGVRLMTFNDQSGDSALMEKIEFQLMSDYYPGEVERLRAALDSGNQDISTAVAESVVSTKANIQKVQTSYPLFSFTSNKKVIVKVTYSLDDANGTGKKQIAYYRFRYGAIGNSWSYEYDSNAVSYYLNFL